MPDLTNGWEFGCECVVSSDPRDIDFGKVTVYRPDCPVHGDWSRDK